MSSEKHLPITTRRSRVSGGSKRAGALLQSPLVRLLALGLLLIGLDKLAHEPTTPPRALTTTYRAASAAASESWATVSDLLPASLGGAQKHKLPKCPAQPAPLVPDLEWRPDLDDEWLRASAGRLSAAVQIPTVSYDGMGPVDEDPRFKVFGDLHAHLAETYPTLHARAELRKYNQWGLLYKLQGSDASLKPALIAAHQDVVPVPDETLDQWTHPPFSGHYDEASGLVWGRGSCDDKGMLVAVMEAVEQLLAADDWQPKRTLYILSGFDEEVGGPRGAAVIGQALVDELGEDSIEYVLDEGGLGIGVEHGVDVAMPALTEKGYLDVKMEVRTPGGHSSMPPDHTAIGILSEFVTTLEANPHKPVLSPASPVLTHLLCVADAMEARGVPEPAAAPAAAHGGQGNGKKARAPGFQLTRKMRKLLRRPSQWGAVARAIDATGTRVERFIIKTSQAVDIIGGGVKANALPEYAAAVVNQRIIEPTAAVKSRFEKLVRPVAEKYGLEVRAFEDKKLSARVDDGPEQKDGPLGSLTLSVLTVSEPTPVSPTDTEAFAKLAGTIKHIFPGRNGTDRLVTPMSMTGNTDSRHTLKLTRNVWKFNPSTYSSKAAKHTVNENMEIRSHAETARFIHALIRNFE